MDQIENQRATAQEIVIYAWWRGFDLESLLCDSTFQKNRRWIFLWRKLDGLPCSGREDEKAGTLKYNMQGPIAVLPEWLKNSTSVFQGGWSEAGTLESIEQAFDLVKAWLIDGKEVDDLPQRSIRRGQI